MAAVFAHGALRLYLLALLEESPKHGYDLIRAVNERFGGTYSPSAGTVYPRLAKLQKEGLVETSLDGRRTVYSLTAAGRAEIDARRSELAGLEAKISASVRRLADDLRTDIRENMRSLRADLAAGAETARVTARTKEPPHRADPGTTGPRLREAELLLQKFRDDLRMDLRLHAARHELAELSLETIRTVLDQAAIAIRTTLKP